MSTRKHRTLRSAGIWGCAFLPFAMGCGVLPHSSATRVPAAPVTLPEVWSQANGLNQGEATLGWIDTFQDSDLERWVREALLNNRDLQTFAAQLKAAHESKTLARAPRLPNLTASVNDTRSWNSARESKGDYTPFESNDDLRLGLNFSWEIDLWGRLANLDQATQAEYQAQLADYRGAALSLAGNTAKAWFNLIASEQQVELALRTRESFESNFRIIERNYKGGDSSASPLDVQFARNQVAAAERGVISQNLARDESKRSLELLLGRYPSAGISSRQDLPALPEDVPAGIPSDLLLRRPDLQAAASDVLASALRSDAATKALLPSFALSASGSTTTPSQDLLDLLADPSRIAFNLAGSLTQPLFRGGSLTARARQALAQNEASVAAFSAIALRALREVESALATNHSLSQQMEFLETELRQANLAEAQATRDYSEGIVGYLSVLEAQRRAFNARSAMINLRNARAQNRVNLFLALGGDVFYPPLPSEPHTLSQSTSP